MCSGLIVELSLRLTFCIWREQEKPLNKNTNWNKTNGGNIARNDAKEWENNRNVHHFCVVRLWKVISLGDKKK